ncbi:Sporulation domain-containing protein [Solidesulfovibrio carbinoliphilus subsp. oakridgensis]|uniref:Sporulation domain-containing protein n=1 Tax=Solidesulfovibrio carbinoliphilus subsp. oakridgensis TaxID=694327 RepID=G7QAH8_9BACT|nr:SPOR domain-containing protein [Solidesulfovibrio carbinoliphilus]EHJ48731.1 Sporulation domain-containing protein [Solidesulfovibrio carbinoliphilus subsp. oakridgensis]
MTVTRLLVLLATLLAVSLGGCAEETVYDWQRPHDTYQVGSFSQYKKAEDLKSTLQKNGFDSRIETDIKNGQFTLNVLVDVYDKGPDTLTRLERISGVTPHLRGPKSGKPASASPPPIPPSGI